MRAIYTPYIYYKKGYKYQLSRDYRMKIGIKPKEDIETYFISLYTDGTLIIKADYCWDGASGPTVDTDTFMRGSLEHDALYQLMRMGLLPRGFRIQADKRLMECCFEDDMWVLRTKWVYRGVRVGGGSSVLAENKKKILRAPHKKRKK